jgi:hypothetical protein
MNGLRIETWWGERFFAPCPYHPWSPTGYKADGAWRWPPNSSAPRLKKEHSCTPSEPSRVDFTFPLLDSLPVVQYSKYNEKFRHTGSVFSSGEKKKVGQYPLSYVSLQTRLSSLCPALNARRRTRHRQPRNTGIEFGSAGGNKHLTLRHAAWYKPADVSTKRYVFTSSEPEDVKLKTRVVSSTEPYSTFPPQSTTSNPGIR